MGITRRHVPSRSSECAWPRSHWGSPARRCVSAAISASSYLYDEGLGYTVVAKECAPAARSVSLNLSEINGPAN